MVGKATPDRGGPRKSPDGVDPKTSGWAFKRTRKTQRDGHNSGVKIWSLCSVSSTLSHANPWTTLSNPCNKLRGKYVVKKSSCVFPLASLSLCRCELFYIYMCMYIDVNLHMWLYNIVRFGACASRVLQGFKTNLVTVNGSLKHHNTTSTKGTGKDAGIERSRKKKQEQTGNYKRNGPARKEQKEKKKTRKQCNVQEEKMKKKFKKIVS